MKAALVYPHQLLFDSPLLEHAEIFYLIEDPLFFSQYNFHKQKIAFHRASMKSYEEELLKKNKTVRYVEFLHLQETSDISSLLIKDKIQEVYFVSLEDDWLEERIKESLNGASISFTEIPHPHFFTSQETIESYTPKGPFFFFNDFYISQRKSLNILIADDKPVGGRWSFDAENRSKLRAGVVVPQVSLPPQSKMAQEAVSYVQKYFSDNIGLCDAVLFPTTRDEALSWCDQFFNSRYEHFGLYEDAIVRAESFLFHSAITPFLNVGLVSPQEIVQKALACEVSINSKEGFIRQVVGWREFIRLIYKRCGRRQRSTNYLNNTVQLSHRFYTAQTGIEPVDVVIERVLKTGYCHHIERLMVLGNFLLLCDIHPDAVYQWFMEMFVDSYDWVMVPNVYGMSQYADGGLMTTKPYISGSSYILKMSDFKKGPWCEVWDGLYWRFIHRHRHMIEDNPRMSVILPMREKLAKTGVLKRHISTAENFLRRLDSR